MRRSFILSTVLAAAAVVGACETKPEAPNKPVATPVPVSSASSIASPAASPVASPVKPGDPTVKPAASPEVKKTDDKAVNKDVKTAPVATPKTK